MKAEHLDDRINSVAVEQAGAREGFGEGLRDAGEDNSQVVALCADLTDSTRVNYFAEAFPKRFIQVGVAEQNLASVASGMAAIGKIPFIASYAMFSPGRNWEQIRTTICYNDANVKIIGAHAGVSVGPDGATHQAIEDIAITRVIPNITVLTPIDKHEAYRMTRFAAEHKGPVYIRFGREKTPLITTKETALNVGRAMYLFRPDTPKVAILSVGTIAHEAYVAAADLTAGGLATSHIHFGTVKPLDTDNLNDIVKDHKLIVTVEEHQMAGGFGGAVAEYLSYHKPTKIIRIGVPDKFGQSGTAEELIKHYGLDTESIMKRVKEAMGE